jgi:hypothetical protein
VNWNYTCTACDGVTTTPWTYTYHVQYSGGLVAPANGGSVITWPAQPVNPGAPANITDACGRTVIPTLVGHSAFPQCSGTVTWTYIYTACDGITTTPWTYTYTITPHHTTSSQTTTASASYFWNANNTTYTLSGVYTATLVNAAGCDSVLTLNLTILGVKLTNVRVFLDGPYDPNTGMMTDSLRVTGQIPTQQPYTNAPYIKTAIGDNGLGRNIAPGVLSVTGSTAITDWVWLELRSTVTPYPVVATRAALLRRNGSIVDTDGVSPVLFPTAPVGNYRVSVKHRNHMGVMTNTAYSLTLAGSGIDFATASLWVKPSNPVIVNTPSKLNGSVQTLWAGDANVNKNVKYNGFQNDKDVILTVIGSGTPNNILPGNYRPEDVNMDGVIKYNNTNADRLIILGTVGSGTPNNIYNQHTPD